MTERERLIELLTQAENKELSLLEFEKKTLADYLLANGVKPLPLKINDIVYGISRGQIIPIQINTIQYTSKGIDICGSNEEYFGYSTIHLDVNNQIGMEWYKTEEKAEKALEEMKKND